MPATNVGTATTSYNRVFVSATSKCNVATTAVEITNGSINPGTFSASSLTLTRDAALSNPDKVTVAANAFAGLCGPTQIALTWSCGGAHGTTALPINNADNLNATFAPIAFGVPTCGNYETAPSVSYAASDKCGNALTGMSGTLTDNPVAPTIDRTKLSLTINPVAAVAPWSANGASGFATSSVPIYSATVTINGTGTAVSAASGFALNETSPASPMGQTIGVTATDKNCLTSTSASPSKWAHTANIKGRKRYTDSTNPAALYSGIEDFDPAGAGPGTIMGQGAEISGTDYAVTGLDAAGDGVYVSQSALYDKTGTSASISAKTPPNLYSAISCGNYYQGTGTFAGDPADTTTLQTFCLLNSYNGGSGACAFYNYNPASEAMTALSTTGSVPGSNCPSPMVFSPESGTFQGTFITGYVQLSPFNFAWTSLPYSPTYAAFPSAFDTARGRAISVNGGGSGTFTNTYALTGASAASLYTFTNEDMYQAPQASGNFDVKSAGDGGGVTTKNNSLGYNAYTNQTFADLPTNATLTSSAFPALWTSAGFATSAPDFGSSSYGSSTFLFVPHIGMLDYENLTSGSTPSLTRALYGYGVLPPPGGTATLTAETGMSLCGSFCSNYGVQLGAGYLGIQRAGVFIAQGNLMRVSWAVPAHGRYPATLSRFDFNESASTASSISVDWIGRASAPTSSTTFTAGAKVYLWNWRTSSWTLVGSNKAGQAAGDANVVDCAANTAACTVSATVSSSASDYVNFLPWAGAGTSRVWVLATSKGPSAEFAGPVDVAATLDTDFVDVTLNTSH